MDLDGRLLGIFQDVFGPEVISVSDDDSPDTIEAWDSASHVNLIMALEAEFEVQFEAEEIAELTTVGAIRERLGEGPSGSSAP